MTLRTSLGRLKQKCHLWNHTVKAIQKEFGEKDFEFVDLIPLVGLYQTLYLCKSEPCYKGSWKEYAFWCIQQMIGTPSAEAAWFRENVQKYPDRAGNFLDFVVGWSIMSKMSFDSISWREDLHSLFDEYEKKFIYILKEKVHE